MSVLYRNQLQRPDLAKGNEQRAKRIEYGNRYAIHGL